VYILLSFYCCRTVHISILIRYYTHNTYWCSVYNIINYSMEQSPSGEANRFSASQKILRILRNPKVHYRVYKCPLLVPILESARELDCSPESIWKKFAKIGAECICWTEHSARNSAQNSKYETARECLQDSGGTDVEGRRLPCENGFLKIDYIEYYRVLLHSWTADLFWWIYFPHQWQIQLQRVGKGDTSRRLATWKRLPRIKICCALSKSRIIGPFFLKEATVNSEFYPALLQGFLIPELRQLNLLRLNLLSARRCTLPLCLECGTVTEWRLPRTVDR